jgi:hypothetical protein
MEWRIIGKQKRTPGFIEFGKVCYSVVQIPKKIVGKIMEAEE